jgi:hypothetical protein
MPGLEQLTQQGSLTPRAGRDRDPVDDLLILVENADVGLSASRKGSRIEIAPWVDRNALGVGTIVPQVGPEIPNHAYSGLIRSGENGEQNQDNSE